MGAEPAAVGAPAGMPRRSLFGRVYGLGSVFAKSVRDSRRALLIAIGFLALVLVTGTAAIASAFGTAETRQEMVNLALTLPSVFQGMLGRPVGLHTLGGLIEWRYAVIISVLLPIWSILALSSTLAGEAGRGSIDLLATTGSTRRRLALEKLGAHVFVVAIAAVAIALLLWLSAAAFATLPGDAIPIRGAAGYAVLAFLLILTPGAIAFAAAPFIGRGAAAGLAGFVMVIGYFLNGFRDSLDLFETLSPLSWYAWTANHIPLAGLEDWPAIAVLGAFVVVLYGFGVVAFERRDVGRTIRVPAPHMPGLLIGLRGVMGRTFGDRVPTAVAWGLGIGLYVLLISGSAKELADAIRQAPALDQIMRFLYPDVDYTTVGGVLQLVFVEFGLIVFGIAAATLVAGWASEETSGRLEVVLSAPMSRASWLVRSALGMYGSIILATAIVSLATAIGASAQGSDAGAPARGAFVLALYGLAWAGVGVAVGGLFRPSYASPTVLVLTIATFLISLFAVALKLPDWVSDLALPVHYGKPMVGDWDPVGIIASLVLAIGGIVVGAWGLSRRDLRG